jgi:hypothetical protein
LTATRKELWTTDYLIFRLKEHLATVPICSNHKTDLLDWYPEGHKNKVIDVRKYYNQAYHYLKIGCLKPVPTFLVSVSELSPRIVMELADLDREDRDYILKQAVALIFQEINNELYHNSISAVLVVKLVE